MKRPLSSRITAIGALAVLAALIAPAFVHSAPPSLAPAEALYHAGKYDEAVPLLKAYLLEHPRDAAAHFYLGRAYLLSDDPWLLAAQGEIKMALACFKANGKVSPILEFSDEYFELRCHLELAKVLIRQIMVLDEMGANPALRAPLLDRCREIADTARDLSPDAREVKQLDQLIEALRRAPRRLMPRRQTAKPASV